jgi:hypothetical protein
MSDRFLIAVGPLVALAAAGCTRNGSSSQSQASPLAPPAVHAPATPARTVELLHELRNHRHYAELGAFLAPPHAATAIDFLLAMDELLVANDEVQAAIREHAPTAPAREWDLAALKNRQGLLSADVRVIDERIEGPQAWVTIQVGDLLPLEIVPMRRIGDRWVYWPESEVGALPDALRGLSRAMKRVANAVARGAVTEDQIRTEFRLRISPRLKAIASAASAPPTTQPVAAAK